MHCFVCRAARGSVRVRGGARARASPALTLVPAPSLARRSFASSTQSPSDARGAPAGGGGDGALVTQSHSSHGTPLGALHTLTSPLLDRSDGLTTLLGADKWGFNVNGVYMRGSILAFPTFTLLWDVTRVVDISPRNIAPVHMIKPKPDLLLIGTGDRTRGVNPALFGYLSRKGIALDVMTTSQAISTFNVLTAERRNVAAALVSQAPVSRDDACLYTDEAVERFVTPVDVAVARALADDVLPRDLPALEAGTLRALPPGDSVAWQPSSAALALGPSSASSGNAAAAAVHASGAAVRSTATRAVPTPSASAPAAKQQYGVVGAGEHADESLLDAEHKAAVAARRGGVRPTGTQAVADAQGDVNRRRSGALGGQGTGPGTRGKKE